VESRKLYIIIMFPNGLFGKFKVAGLKVKATALSKKWPWNLFQANLFERKIVVKIYGARSSP